MTDYTIYASKRIGVSKTSREMERFVVEQDDGTFCEQAKRELKGSGYRVHGVIPQCDPEETTEETMDDKPTVQRSRRNGRQG